MILKTIAAVALAAAPVAASGPSMLVPVTPAAIAAATVKVDCIGSMGTAFRISEGLILSVNHVTKNQGCFIDGKPIKVLYAHPRKDFSMLKGHGGPALPVDCGGFVRGRKYLATGHARGLDELTTIELTSTGEMDGQFSVLKGILTVIPGQSGGAITDKITGRVVGTINVYNSQSGMSGSVSLKGTSICSGIAQA